MKSALKRIGVVELNDPGWTGGLHFIRLLAKALDDACRDAGVEVLVLTDHVPNGDKSLILDDADRIVTVVPRNHIRGKKLLRGLLQLPDNSDLLETARKNKIKVLLPLLSIPGWRCGIENRRLDSRLSACPSSRLLFRGRPSCSRLTLSTVGETRHPGDVDE